MNSHALISQWLHVFTWICLILAGASMILFLALATWTMFTGGQSETRIPWNLSSSRKALLPTQPPPSNDTGSPVRRFAAGTFFSATTGFVFAGVGMVLMKVFAKGGDQHGTDETP